MPEIVFEQLRGIPTKLSQAASYVAKHSGINLPLLPSMK